MDNITSPPPPPVPKSNGDASSISNPLIISTIGIVCTSLAIVLYHMVLVRYCIRRHASAATAARPASAAGVDAEILKSIPILAFSVVKRGGADLDECVVCLGELDEDDEVRLLPDCEHAFHVTCIDQWLAAHASCPLCRSPIVLERANDDPSVESPREIDSEPPRERSFVSLRHCPTAPPQMKRSLSMDQYFVAIDLQSVDCSNPSSSPRSDLSHCDRVSSKLRRSFSLLRLGRATRRPILPY